MGKFQVPENPDFSIDLEEIGVERAYPSIFNTPLRRLLINSLHLKNKVDIAEKHAANNGAHVTEEQKQQWTDKAANVLATPAEKGLMSPEDKAKISTIQAGAEVNQYAINNIRVGNTNVYSNAKEGQIILVPGSNITISADNATKIITISANVPINLPANGGHASTCDRAYNSNWADGATNANNAGAVRGFPFAVAIQAGAPGDGNALWVW